MKDGFVMYFTGFLYNNHCLYYIDFPYYKLDVQYLINSYFFIENEKIKKIYLDVNSDYNFECTLFDFNRSLGDTLFNKDYAYWSMKYQSFYDKTLKDSIVRFLYKPITYDDKNLLYGVLISRKYNFIGLHDISYEKQHLKVRNYTGKVYLDKLDDTFVIHCDSLNYRWASDSLDLNSLHYKSIRKCPTTLSQKE
ncbi:hypothetical protein [Chondrinema litorale]|uniref:hypothetical protein n=1 Tax=Chondrinema litorale TaxID=2994555 RepID=UPI002542E9B7|nr:hypothetical protein [Chondrinema litorale]UZR99099.1 hypothetical protein OQ292_35100 [Chondrinema litorale]